MLMVYRFLYALARILVTVLRPVLPQALRDWIDLRSRKPDAAQMPTSCIWFHASSGEIEYCKSVIRLLKKQRPDEKIAVTYSSPSAEKLFHNIRAEVDLFLPLPWDQPSQTAELIRYLHPKVLVFSRTDIWPELLYQARRQGVKTGVISYNPRLKILTAPIIRWLLAQLDFISCLDEQSKNRLRLITDTPLTADGDTRFDQVFYRLSQKSKLNIQNKKYWVCGSTWPEDEAVIFRTFPNFLKNHYKIVLSPHEVNPENMKRVHDELVRLGFTCSFFSAYPDAQNIEIQTDILIMDRIGYLADCYRQATLAFVGGSFKDKVHSVMEPLCCGLPVLVGPHYQNNPEAVRYHGLYVMSVHDAAQLNKVAASIALSEGEKITAAMKKNQNASEKVLKLIIDCSQEK